MHTIPIPRRILDNEKLYHMYLELIEKAYEKKIELVKLRKGVLEVEFKEK